MPRNKKQNTIDMKTQKETFINMLESANIFFVVVEQSVIVENKDSGYVGFNSCWEFDDSGDLIKVGHFEN